MSNLEITAVLLVHFNTVSRDCLQDSRDLYTFIRNKLFGHLLDISSKTFLLYF